MKRRERERQKKRKQRAERVRRKKHEERAASSAAAADAPPDEDAGEALGDELFGASDGGSDDGDDGSDDALEDGSDDSPDGGSDDGRDEDLDDDLGDDLAEGSPFVGLFDDERRQRRVMRIAEAARNGDDPPDAALLVELLGLDLETLDERHPPHPDDLTQDIAFEALEAAGRTDDRHHALAARTFARSALVEDPRNADARTVLVCLEVRRAADRIAPLRAIAAEALEDLGGLEVVERLGGQLGLLPFARPWLRTRRALAEALLDAGRTAEAIAELEELLALDDEDQAQARLQLAGLYLDDSSLLLRARALLAADAGSPRPMLAWGRVLERFMSGDRRGAAAALSEARRRQPWVEDFILGEADVADADDPSASLEEHEAGAVFSYLAPAWRRQREARRWLADGGLASTKAERRAAHDSYPAHLRALLTAGEPRFRVAGPDGQDWVADQVGFRIGHDDVPDLLRMLEDPALSEVDKGEPALYAGVHAWRALALLAARGDAAAAAVAGVFMRWLHEHSEDDWFGYDAPSVFGLVGPTCIPALSEALEHREALGEHAATVIHALEEIAARHPAAREQALGLLMAALRAEVEEAESLAEFEFADDDDGDAQPHEELDGSDAWSPTPEWFASELVAALSALHAGRGPHGLEVMALVSRAYGAELVDERDCGPWPQVRAELQGSSDG